MANVGSLNTSLTLESSQFIVGLKKSVDATQRSASAIESGINKIVTAAKGFAAAIALNEIVGVAQRALDYASSLGEVSQQLGVTTRDLQVYRYAATQVGVSQDEMDAGLSKLTRTIGEAAAGGKSQVAAFRELGVSITDANGKISTAGEVIPRLADAFSRIKDPATRARLEVDLFGKAGQKLDTLLAGGSAAIDELKNAAARLGVVLSDDAIANADQTADKLAEIKMVLEANIANAVASNADAVFSLADSFIQLASSIPGAVDSIRRFRAEAAIALANEIDADLGWLPQSVLGTDAARAGANKQLSTLKDAQRTSNLRSMGLLVSPRINRASSGALPTFTPSSAKPKAKRSGGKSAESSKSDPFADFQRDARIGVGDAMSWASGNMGGNPSADSADELYSRIGINRAEESDAVFKQISREREARIDMEMELRDVRAKAAEDAGNRMADQTRTVAGLYESLMRGGTKSFLRDFKDIGLSIVAQMVAKLAIGAATGKGAGSLGSIFSSAVSSTLPGFATGGSFKVGGAPGIDRNLIAFRATRGEMVDVRRPGQGSSSASPVSLTINAPGATGETVAMIRRELANAAPVIIQAAQRSTVSSIQRPRL